MPQTTRAFLGSSLGIFIIGLAGCATLPKPQPQPSPFLFHSSTVTCDQANHIAYRIVQEAGYTVTAFAPATNGGTGTMAGSKPRGAGEDTITAKITCGPDGIHAEGDYGHGPTAMNQRFPEYFFVRFTGMAEAAERGEVNAPGQILVKMKPLIGFETSLEFGALVNDVLPVRVDVINTTQRAYALEVETIVLLTRDGKRVKSLQANGNTFPAPPLTSLTLAPGASIKGYLYFPPGSYASGRGFVTEQDSQEREGFDVQF
jgi:hypothetical protein